MAWILEMRDSRLHEPHHGWKEIERVWGDVAEAEAVLRKYCPRGVITWSDNKVEAHTGDGTLHLRVRYYNWLTETPFGY